jgi:DNA-directed RNA polymerase subunit RPC12/RpoP
MDDNHEEYVPQLKTNFNFVHGEPGHQQADENNENIFRTADDAATVAGDSLHHYYPGFEYDLDCHDHFRRVRPCQQEYPGEYTHYQHTNERLEGRTAVHAGQAALDKNISGIPYVSSHSNQLAGNDALFMNGSHTVAAVPIPATALPVSNRLHNCGESGAPSKPRCIEEEYTVILHRSSTAEAKSANTKYRCLFCNFTFVGGPQKIRVHLTGKRENGTRLSRCEHCPEDVRRKLEERMKAPREAANEIGLYDDDNSDLPSLPPRNVEEHHTTVLSRSQSSNSKSSNTRYKCIYCRFRFVGGPQKIRVHLTGQQEGGTRMQKCPRVPNEVVTLMEHRRKIPKPDLLATCGGSANVVTSSTIASSSHVGQSVSAKSDGAPSAAQAQQQAFAISEQKLALLKQQQHNAAQMQAQEQALLMQRQRQLEQQLYTQQHIQHLQLLYQQQMQAQTLQQLQHPLQGAYPLNTHPASAQQHGSSLLLHLPPQYMLEPVHPTSPQVIMHQ